MEVEEKDTQLRERDTQIDRQQRELQAVRVRNARQRCCVVVVISSIWSPRRTRGDFRWRWRRRTPNSERGILNCSDRTLNSERGILKSTGSREN